MTAWSRPPAPAAPPPPPAPSADWFPPVVPEASAAGRLLALGVVTSALVLFGLAADLLVYAVSAAGGLVVGALVAEATGVDRWFRSRSGLLLGGLCSFALWAAAIFGAGAGAPLGEESIPILLAVPAVVVGLDTRRVDRLRPLVVLAALPVLVAAWIEPAWMVVALLVWGLAALGTFALLERDRRAALPLAQQELGAAARAGAADLVVAMALAVGIAVVAAVLLSVPSCQRDVPDPPGPFDGSPLDGGTLPSGGELPGEVPDGLLVPDADGDVLVPDDGSGRFDELRPDEPIPVPERVPVPPDDRPLGFELGDGYDAEVEVLADGDRLVTVTGPDGQVWRYRLAPEGDQTRITRIGPDGQAERSWTYDPDGRLAVPADEAGRDLEGEDLGERDPDEQRGLPDIDGWTVAGVVAALAALAAAGWWWARRRRRHEPDASGVAPWALALVRRLEALGRERGRPRRSDEAPVAYARALLTGPVPDPAVVEVAEVVADALYGPGEVDPQRRRWAEAEVRRLEGAPVPVDG